MKINTLFDPKKGIYRAIEKVITYGASQEARLRAEISEYIVTRNIENELEKLLDKMQAAMEMGGQNEVGVWVSGFYGSGKSSFTKYLGLALDERVKIDGIRFLEYLQNRLTKPQTKALLNTVATRYPTAVILLDLASEMLAGATMEDVSTVLYYKVLQWAGYSQNLKIAALERRLKKDNLYQTFTDRIQHDVGMSWKDVQNDPLVTDSVIPEIAHDLYPQLFKSPSAFTTATSDFVRFENDRVKEMIDIAREASGKDYIVFIVDEVGQYVAASPNLILNLDGLAKNLKNLGNGKVWLMGTAQQTLTEDDPKATLNSPQLYKLKDRFPIQIELESNDIKEICYRRLLGKTPEGEQVLGKLFDQHGPALRHNIKLADASVYSADFDKTLFVNLYPFLPAHFDILLHLLGALAKSTGGLGLRSAIKVIQDILIEGPDDRSPSADQEIGWLATTVTLYDALEKDIRRAYPSIHAGVNKAVMQFATSPIHQDVAKTVAILQVLHNMPATPQNVASLLHPAIDAASRRDEVDAAVHDLITHAFVPFGEKDGGLCFFSERLNDIDQERAGLRLINMDIKRIQNEALQEVFSPLPSTRLNSTRAVTAGLKAMNGNTLASLAGERETIQLAVAWVEPKEYDTARARLVDDSRQRSAQHTVYLLGRAAPEIDARLAEIFRCRDIASRHRNDPDQDVKEYCTSQIDRANRLAGELKTAIARGLGLGSFIFRGDVTPVDTLDPEVQEAARKHLASVARQVFDRYAEAPVQIETGVAEKLLRLGNLRGVSATTDPLGLVEVKAGTPHIKTDHKALVSIRDTIDKNGIVDGKRLTDVFGDAPFGWSSDTLRYLVAALLMAGEIKLKVSGREVTVNGQQAIEALRTNNSFKAVGVSLRNDRPSTAMLSRAAQRLETLTGDSVLPLEDEISKTATRHLSQLQARNATLAGKLEALHLPGTQAVSEMNREIGDLLLTDASDAPQRLGAQESPLFQSLTWANDVDLALKQGLEKTVSELQEHQREIEALPDIGVPGSLRAELAETLAQLADQLRQDSFYLHGPDLSTTLTRIKVCTRNAANQMAEDQLRSIAEAKAALPRLPDWKDLTFADGQDLLGKFDGLTLAATPDLKGLKRLFNQDYLIQNTARALRIQVEQTAAQRRQERAPAITPGAQIDALSKPPTPARPLGIPAHLPTVAALDALIQRLQALRAELNDNNGNDADAEIDIRINLED